MAKGSPKPPELKPWNRRPWAVAGDTDASILYAAVGRALSQWERLEAQLSLLFSAFVSGHNSEAARRAYVAVRTFEGRAEMLRAVSETWFDSHPNAELLDDFKKVLSGISSFAPNRNDIAHGVVDFWTPSGAPADFETPNFGWALYPSYASFKDRDVRNVPKYCYTSAEIGHFEKEFRNQLGPVGSLTHNLGVAGLFTMGAIGPLSL
jgi:hypothetical protein